MTDLITALLWILLLGFGLAIAWGRDQYQHGFKAGYKQRQNDVLADDALDRPTYGNDT